MSNISINASDIYCRPLYAYEDMQEQKIKKLSKRIQELENKKTVDLPERYIINDGATILFWNDGDKTIVKRASDDVFNARLAFLTAFFQHYCGMSKNKANKFLASLQVENKKQENKPNKYNKLKVGDKVCIKKNLEVDGVYGTNVFVDNMACMRGKEVTIAKVETNGEYRIKEYDYSWTNEMFDMRTVKRKGE